MPRCSVAERSSNTITALRGPGVFAASGRDFALREIGVFNTEANAMCVGIKRATANGGGGTALTEVAHCASSYTVQATGVNTPTADHTASGGGIMQGTLGAAVGSYVIWTFGGDGLEVPAGTGNGVFIYLPTGTARVVDFYFVWDE